MKYFKVKQSSDENTTDTKHSIHIYNDVAGDYVFYTGNMSLSRRDEEVTNLLMKGWTRV